MSDGRTDRPHESEYQGRAVLVTGGAGFIGSTLSRRLAALGARVTAVDAMIADAGGNPYNLQGGPESIVFRVMDIGDAAISEVVKDQSIVFNLAGQVSHIDSMRDPVRDLDSNCRGHLSLLQACRAVNPGVKIVYASTRQVYGSPERLPMDEFHPVRPLDINGIHKAACESYHLLYRRVYGLRASCLRLTNTYGPRMLVKHARQTALGWFLRRAIDGTEIEIWGDGMQRRDYTFVDDVVDAFLRAGVCDAVDGRCVNIGGLEPTSHVDLMRALVGASGTGSWRLVPFPPEFKPIDIGDAWSSNALAADLLGWRPTTGLVEGLTRSVRFFRAHREHYWT